MTPSPKPCCEGSYTDGHQTKPEVCPYCTDKDGKTTGSCTPLHNTREVSPEKKEECTCNCICPQCNPGDCPPEVSPEKEEEDFTYATPLPHEPSITITPTLTERKGEWEERGYRVKPDDITDLDLDHEEQFRAEKNGEYVMSIKVDDAKLFIAAKKQEWEASLKQKMKEDTRIALLLLANHLGVPEKTAKKEIEIILNSLPS